MDQALEDLKSGAGCVRHDSDEEGARQGQKRWLPDSLSRRNDVYPRDRALSRVLSAETECDTGPGGVERTNSSSIVRCIEREGTRTVYDLRSICRHTEV